MLLAYTLATNPCRNSSDTIIKSTLIRSTVKKNINIGLLGLGSIGSGVYNVLRKHGRDYKQNIGASIAIKKIAVKNKRKKRDVKVDPKLLTTDASSIINDPEIDIVIELIGGTKLAKNLIIKALNNKKHVVTANKEIMAQYGKELFDTANKNEVDLYFEASVGGGIPIIKPLKDSLEANKITKIMGIVNGTTNYILSKMSDEDLSYEQALKEAQEKGFAEADPKADVGGGDAASKIAILASIAFNSRITKEKVFIEGITSITPKDIDYAADMGHVIKLLAIAKHEDEKAEVRVHPTMIKNDHPLAAVNGAYNAIFVEGDAVGEVMFFGQGAGSLPTASAVIADTLEIVKNINTGVTGKRMVCTCYDKIKIKPMVDITSSFYLRMKVADKPGVLAKISKIFGDNKASIKSVIQKGPAVSAGRHGRSAELIFITHPVVEANLRKALTGINKLDQVIAVKNVIRVEED